MKCEFCDNLATPDNDDMIRVPICNKHYIEAMRLVIRVYVLPAMEIGYQVFQDLFIEKARRS